MATEKLISIGSGNGLLHDGTKLLLRTMFTNKFQQYLSKDDFTSANSIEWNPSNLTIENLIPISHDPMNY